MKALLIVDMQNDFMPGGALAVPQADEIIPLINKLIAKFPFVVATKDWHPQDHESFAQNHVGKRPGEEIQVGGIVQVLWPTHCVRNSYGSELVQGLDQDRFDCIFYKGTDHTIDSYSAFFDNARLKSTGLGDYLKSRGVDEIYIVGVATDYCVLYSTIDALDQEFAVTVIADACRGIDLEEGDVEKAFGTMREKGARVIFSDELEAKARKLI